MEKEELFDKIEAYLIGRMDAEERIAFEKQIAADEDLAIEVEFQRLEHDAMNTLVEKKLRGKMAQWKVDLPDEESSLSSPLSIVVDNRETAKSEAKVVSLSSRLMRYAAAASLILGVIITGLWVFKNPKPQAVVIDNTTKPDSVKTTPSNEKPKEEVAQNPIKPIEKQNNGKPKDSPKTSIPPPDNLGTGQYKDLLAYVETNLDEEGFKIESSNRGENNGVKNDMKPIVEAYKAKNYTQSLGLLQKLPTSNSSVEGLGLVYFKLKQYDKAIASFKSVVEDPFLKERTQWNLVLCYYAQYPSKATELNNMLDVILKDAEHEYFGRAKGLKGRL
jgi:hypothetical protein